MPDPSTGPLGLETVLVNIADWNEPYTLDELPDDAVIVNAPRPLYGFLTWQGRCRCGIFYAAAPYVPASGQNPAEHYRWRQNGARQLVFITNDDIYEACCKKAAEYNYPTLAAAKADGITFECLLAAVRLPWHGEHPAE
jgi:hypothetical protein